jgi:hypothetical protein
MMMTREYAPLLADQDLLAVQGGAAYLDDI